jgi:hypothetical protein
MTEVAVRYHPQVLTAAAFAAYGVVVESDQDGFTSVLQRPDADGWQAGINRVSTTIIGTLHCHVDTWECFAPIDAGLAIAVASAAMRSLDDPATARSHIDVFALTAPVCVSPGTWHSLMLRTPDGESGASGVADSIPASFGPASPIPANSGPVSPGRVFVCENAQVSGMSLNLPWSVRSA